MLKGVLLTTYLFLIRYYLYTVAPSMDSLKITNLSQGESELGILALIATG